MSIDLHIHSVNSDGTFSVEEIVNLSKELQLEAISITDHEYLTEVPSDNDIKIIKGIAKLFCFELIFFRVSILDLFLLICFFSDKFI